MKVIPNDDKVSRSLALAPDFRPSRYVFGVIEYVFGVIEYMWRNTFLFKGDIKGHWNSIFFTFPAELKKLYLFK